MKKGFVGTLLAIIVAIVLIAGGAYYYQRMRGNNQLVSTTSTTTTQSNTEATSTNLPTTSTSQQINTAGMTKYTDPKFGFSFWYPTSWEVKENTTDRISLASSYTGGTIIKTVTVSSVQDSGYGVAISEFVSSDKSITDNSNCGPADGCPSSIRYYFDAATHTWMLQQMYQYPGPGNSSPDKVTPANVSYNSMGGLHILGGNARFGDDLIIPLSASHFLVVYDMTAGGTNIGLLAKTITALNSLVATPVSSAEQKHIIQQEAVLYGAIGTQVQGGNWYKDNQNVYDRMGDIIAGANPKTFSVILKCSDGSTPCTGTFATDGVHVYSDEQGLLSGADAATFVTIRQAYQIPYAPSSGRFGQSFTAYDTAYSKDKSHVWFWGQLIPSADPKTFVVTGDLVAKDANHTYDGTDYVHHKFKIDGAYVNLQ